MLDHKEISDHKEFQDPKETQDHQDVTAQMAQPDPLETMD